MSLSLLIRAPSLRGSLFAAVSALALSGCVSAVNEKFDNATVPKTGATVADKPAVAGEQNEQIVQQSDGPALEQVASNQSADQGTDAGNQMAGLVNQPTGISATQNSIFANGATVQSQTDDGAQGLMPLPAFVPVPAANPAVKSLYQHDLASQAATLDAQAAKLHAIEQPVQQQVQQASQQPKAAANDVAALQAKPQAVTAIETPNAQGLSSAAAPKPQSAPGAKAPAGGDRTLTLAAFFAAAAKKGNTSGLNASSDGTDSFGSAGPGAMGIAFGGRSSMDESFDDEHEEDTPPPAGLMKLASLGSLSRVAPNGLRLQTETVSVGCMKPELIRKIKAIEAHYKTPVVVTSGFRPRVNNVRKGSLHHSCDAADVQVAGVSKWELAKYLRSQPDRGGVGTYCHTESVHLDTGDVRDWNWRCRAPQKKS